MTELIDLLKRWVELEPGRCDLTEHSEDKEGRFTLNIRDNEPSRAHVWLEPYVDSRDLAIVQQAVQRAIVSHDLRFSLENAADGLHFAAVRGTSQHSTCLAQDKEPALALLKAYLAWLEKRVEVTQVTAGGGSET